jgi:HEAT repeat protein
MTNRLTQVIVAGHAGDADAARTALTDDDPAIRAAALGALDRCDSLTGIEIDRGLSDEDPKVRRRAVELAARRPAVTLVALLDDPDPDVVEVAAWACGEQLETADEAAPEVVDRLAQLVFEADEPLVREAAAAALGAIGDPSGLPAILHACADKPHVRRRAVLALAPFDGPEVDAAIERALDDRDWQVRQAAEDLRRAIGELDT